MSSLALKRRLALAGFDLRRALGRAGALGVTLMVGAAILLALAVRMQDEAVALGERAEALRARRAAPSAAVLRALDPARDPVALRDSLPPATQSQEDLHVIFRLAADQRIALARGDYTSTIRRGVQVVDYDVALPVRAPYPAVRSLVARVLNALPHAALSELRLERGQSTAGAVEARIRFTLHYREEPR